MPWRKRDPKHLFPLGQIITTADAWQVLQRNDMCASDLVERHVAGDWGVICASEKAANDWSAKNGHPLRSTYALGNDRITVWTHGDRSSTEVMTLDEADSKYGGPVGP